MKRLLLLILLSVGFTNVSFASDLCPNGSNPKRTVSSDGSYFVYKCSLSSSSYSSGDSFNIPANASATGSTFTCNKNYYRNNAKTACLRIPANASSSNTSNYYICNTGYKKSGKKCIPRLDIPINAHKALKSWTCDLNYYRNNTKTGCLKVPENAYSSYTSNIFSCIPGYKKTGFNSCIPRLATPSYRN